MLAQTSQIILNEKPIDGRIFFSTNALRDDFFERLRNHFGTWVELRRNLKIYRSRLERFRNGSISIPHGVFLQMLNYLEERNRNFFMSHIFIKNRNWGRVKGGQTTYFKHPEIFKEGRKIGGQRSRYIFRVDMPLTNGLAEIIGAFIGDGFTGKYGNSYIVQFTGDGNLDQDYHLNTLTPLIKELSPGSNPKLTKKDNTLRLTIYSKEFHNLLTKRFRFKKGVKVYTVNIPEEILESKNYTIINRCIRGIFDTDGYVFFDKRGSYNRPYLRIGVQMVSPELIKLLHNLLNKQGIKATITRDCRKVQINGFNECKKFVNIIGFSNYRHLRKLAFL